MYTRELCIEFMGPYKRYYKWTFVQMCVCVYVPYVAYIICCCVVAHSYSIHTVIAILPSSVDCNTIAVSYAHLMCIRDSY